MGQYAELKDKLSSIMVREEEGPLEMLTDLGADCFAKVKVGNLDSKENGRAGRCILGVSSACYVACIPEDQTPSRTGGKWGGAIGGCVLCRP